MNRQSITGVIMIILAGLMIAGCTQHEDTIKIGQLAALTGFGSASGTAEMQAVALAISEVNTEGGIDGQQIGIIVEDIQSDPTKTITAYTKLRDADGVNIIIGPTWNTFTSAVIPVAKDDNMFIITPSASFDKEPNRSPLFFSTFYAVKWANEPVVADLKAKGYTRIAVVHDQNSFIQTMYEYFKEEAERQDIRIIVEAETDVESKDYRTIITKIKEDTEVQAVYALTSFWPNTGEFLKQKHEIGLDLPVYTLPEVETQAYQDVYAQYSEGVLYMQVSDGPKKADFLKRFQQLYGHAPSSSTAENAYDAANLVVLALKSGARTPDEIAAFMRSVKDYEGASETITFDEFGQVAYRTYYLKTIKEGKLIKYEN